MSAASLAVRAKTRVEQTVAVSEFPNMVTTLERHRRQGLAQLPDSCLDSRVQERNRLSLR